MNRRQLEGQYSEDRLRGNMKSLCILQKAVSLLCTLTSLLLHSSSSKPDIHKLYISNPQNSMPTRPSRPTRMEMLRIMKIVRLESCGVLEAWTKGNCTAGSKSPSRLTLIFSSSHRSHVESTDLREVMRSSETW